MIRLEGDGARVLQAACIGSRAIDIDLVAALAGLPRPMVENQLALLERRRFVTFDGERYVVGTPLHSQACKSNGWRRGSAACCSSGLWSCWMRAATLRRGYCAPRSWPRWGRVLRGVLL